MNNFIPNNTQVIIPIEKITQYRLSDTHPDGKHKARMFKSLGYSLNNIDVFIQDLKISAEAPYTPPPLDTSHGTKYLVISDWNPPNKKIVPIVTIWIILKEADSPKLVTAYPSKKS